MSLIHAVCPWCGAHYTFGIVGHSMIGSGHQCKAQKECGEEGCTEAGQFYVLLDGGSERGFRCADHLDGHPTTMVQAKSAEANKQGPLA